MLAEFSDSQLYFSRIPGDLHGELISILGNFCDFTIRQEETSCAIQKYLIISDHEDEIVKYPLEKQYEIRINKKIYSDNSEDKGLCGLEFYMGPGPSLTELDLKLDANCSYTEAFSIQYKLQQVLKK